MSVIGKGKITTQKGVSVGTIATLLLNPNPNRIRAELVNDSAQEAYAGPTSSVTATANDANQGVPMVQNAVINDLDTNGAWYGIVASGTATIIVTEVS